MADEIGKLKIAFDGDFNDIKMALSEVSSALKNIEGEAGRLTGGFDTLSGLVGGRFGAAVSALGKGFSLLAGGVSSFLDEQPDIVMAQEELNTVFREMAEDVAPEMGEAMSSLADLIGEIWDGIGDDVINVIGLMGDGIDKLLEYKEAWDTLLGKNNIDNDTTIIMTDQEMKDIQNGTASEETTQKLASAIDSSVTGVTLGSTGGTTFFTSDEDRQDFAQVLVSTLMNWNFQGTQPLMVTVPETI